ncbi:hypothetical protein J6O48_13170 [bacterium]|nr:hypothetical protein [bacterium]
MRIQITYFGKFEKNGKLVSGIWCGEKPENAIITEEREILFPYDGKILKHKETEITFSTVWLRDGDVAENYEEIEEERITPNDIINEDLSTLDSREQ